MSPFKVTRRKERIDPTLEAPSNLGCPPATTWRLNFRTEACCWCWRALSGVEEWTGNCATTTSTSFLLRLLSRAVPISLGVKLSKVVWTIGLQTLSWNKRNVMKHKRWRKDAYLIYIRWVRLEPVARSLPLSYHDLANPNAAITYQVDGTPVTPVEGKLFSSKGQHLLQ